jgi:KDO2-lipid IV(A) lauroyltransferase
MKRGGAPTRSRWIIDAAAYCLAWAGLRAFQHLPYWLARRAGHALAGTAYALDTRRRQVMQDNLRMAFGGDRFDESEHRRIALAVYRHWGTLLADVPHILRSVRDDNWTSFLDENAFEPLRQLQSGGRGIILVTGHIGNPEFAGWLAALAGFPITSVANEQANGRLNVFLERLRTGSGQRIIYRHGAIRQGMRILARGEIVAFLADLHSGRNGVSADFFGRQAPTIHGPAVLAIRSGAPILPVAVVRESIGLHYRAVYGEPILPIGDAPRNSEVRRLTQAYTSALEAFIRRWPEQWIWFHRRWDKPAARSRPRPRSVHGLMRRAETNALSQASDEGL